MTRALACLVLGLALLAHGHGRAAEAPSLAFDPKACSQDAKGQFYISLGRAVFGIPSPRNLVVFPDRKPIMISMPADPSIALVPPAPTDPVGCPGNPQQMRSLEWPEHLFVGDGPNKAHLQKMSMNHMTLAQIGDGKLKTEEDAENSTWGADKNYKWDNDKLGWAYVEGSPSSVCTLSEAVIKTSPGLTICTRSDVQENITPTLFIMRKPLYDTPRDENFILMCPGNPNRHCETGYIAAGNYGITYNIQQNNISNEDTVKEVIAFDKQLRDVIESHRLKNYPWPKQP